MRHPAPAAPPSWPNRGGGGGGRGRPPLTCSPLIDGNRCPPRRPLDDTTCSPPNFPRATTTTSGPGHRSTKTKAARTTVININTGGNLDQDSGGVRMRTAVTVLFGFPFLFLFLFSRLVDHGVVNKTRTESSVNEWNRLILDENIYT
jgi:hypothetical protein